MDQPKLYARVGSKTTNSGPDSVDFKHNGSPSMSKARWAGGVEEGLMEEVEFHQRDFKDFKSKGGESRALR